MVCNDSKPLSKGLDCDQSAEVIDGRMHSTPLLSERDLVVFRTIPCKELRERGQCRFGNRCRFSHSLKFPRRNPDKYSYLPSYCANIQFMRAEDGSTKLINNCKMGRNCMGAHTIEEQLFHPLIYKTKMCPSHPHCNKVYCSWAHGKEELRFPKEGLSPNTLLHVQINNSNNSCDTSNTSNTGRSKTASVEDKFDQTNIVSSDESNDKNTPRITVTAPPNEKRYSGDEDGKLQSPPMGASPVMVSPTTDSTATSMYVPLNQTSRLKQHELNHTSNSSSADSINSLLKLIGELSPNTLIPSPIGTSPIASSFTNSLALASLMIASQSQMNSQTLNSQALKAQALNAQAMNSQVLNAQGLNSRALTAQALGVQGLNAQAPTSPINFLQCISQINAANRGRYGYPGYGSNPFGGNYNNMHAVPNSYDVANVNALLQMPSQQRRSTNITNFSDSPLPCHRARENSI